MRNNITKTMLKFDLTEINAEKRRHCLTVCVGKDMGLMIPLEGTMSIGRNTESSITLNDELVSWDHCRVTNFNGSITLHDNNSRNSVFVDKLSVDDCVLNVGSNIQIGDTVMKLELLSDQEVELRQSLYHRANFDLLTGCYNRHYFEEIAKQEFSISKREQTSLKLVMIDIDHFKKINDTYGHLAGDYILREVAGIIQNSLRAYDLLCRYGGEEFILLLRGAISIGDTEKLCERIRTHIQDSNFEYRGITINLTISIGACFQDDINELTLGDIIAKADKALYDSKRSGRNRITLVK
jgi:diguanylate cyclase (GGDEF)-like protein